MKEEETHWTQWTVHCWASQGIEYETNHTKVTCEKFDLECGALHAHRRTDIIIYFQACVHSTCIGVFIVPTTKDEI